jgi:Holliday junction resolvase RusA-like endonuclease
MTGFSISAYMKPMGKARPRLSYGRIHMPAKYVAWKKKFADTAWHQARGSAIVGKFSCDITILTKTGNIRSDIDNAAGSVLDALQDRGIIKNDKGCISLWVRINKHNEDLIVVCLLETSCHS